MSSSSSADIEPGLTRPRSASTSTDPPSIHPSKMIVITNQILIVQVSPLYIKPASITTVPPLMRLPQGFFVVVVDFVVTIDAMVESEKGLSSDFSRLKFSRQKF
jgi:hypothetical protein